MFILLIRNLLPVSRRTVYMDMKIMLDLLHVQTEFMMMNRREIVVLAANKETAGKKSPSVVSKTNNIDDMFG